MKLTSKGRYAVMAMADLAKNDNPRPVPLNEISLRQGISIFYLEQLFLKKNSLRSHKHAIKLCLFFKTIINITYG